MRTNDGKELRATGATEIVDELRAMSHTPSLTRRAFRDSTAERVRLQVGQRVRTDTDVAFIEDLVAIGFLVEDETLEVPPNEDR